MTQRPDNALMKRYRQLEQWPGGRKLFTLAVCRRAPYFSTVRPRLLTLEQDFCSALIQKRRAVENHIRTLHVIAICNGLEFAMGVMAEVSIPPHLRWIPKGMEVRYTGKADSDIRVEARVEDGAWEHGPDVPVQVRALRADGETVVEGTIHLWVTEKPER